MRLFTVSNWLLAVTLIGAAACGAQSTGADFYVAPNGDDTAPGTISAPFATVDRARSAVASLKQSSAGRTTPIVVMLRGGTYYLKSTLQFGASDSGTASLGIVYQAYPGEAPIISGGAPVTGWSQTAPGVWTTTLPANFQNFEQLFVNAARRYRPRTTKSGYLFIASSVYVSSASANCKNQVQGQGYICADRFQFKPGDLQSSYANINDVEIDDFEKWDMSKMRLKSVDAVNNIAYMTGPASQGSATDHGFLTNHRYIVENVKEALSQPGEWYLDRGSTPWTLTYLSKPGEDLTTATVIAPQAAQVLVAAGLQYVTFRGITFSHDNWVIPAAGYPSAQGEPAVPAAVSFTNANYVSLDSCTIAHTAGFGVEFVGNSANNRIVNSAIYDIGGGGIRLGTPNSPQDTETSVAQSNLVQNNAVNGGGRVIPSALGIFLGDTHHNTVTHNDIWDFYYSGIGLCVPAGTTSCPVAHDNVFSFNHIWQIGQGVTSDMGGIYLGLSTASGGGNQVLNNRIHDVTNDQDAVGYGGNGIYIDHLTHDALVKNNLVYRVSWAALNFTEGINNTVANNILAYGLEGLIQRSQDNPAGPTFTIDNNILFWDTEVQTSLWSCTDSSNNPVPCTTKYQFDYNLYWSPSGAPPTFTTTMQRPGQAKGPLSFAQWKALGEDVHSQSADPQFVNPTYPADDFRLEPSSPAFGLGFAAFDPTQAGRTSATLTPPALDPTWPVSLLDPAKDFGQPAKAVQSPRPLHRRTR
jgi:hypothetical protein